LLLFAWHHDISYLLWSMPYVVTWSFVLTFSETANF
jgi:hypothetical protein